MNFSAWEIRPRPAQQGTQRRGFRRAHAPRRLRDHRAGLGQQRFPQRAAGLGQVDMDAAAVGRLATPQHAQGGGGRGPNADSSTIFNCVLKI